MNSKPKGILVIDSDLGRGCEMLKPFLPYGNAFFFDSNASSRYELKFKTLEEDRSFEKSELPSLLLVLIHGGDKEFQNIVASQTRIWYGGYGRVDPRMPEDDFRIWRKIMNSHFLTDDEALQLIEFAKDQIGVPNFLYHPKDNDKTEQLVFILNKLLAPEKVNWEKISKERVLDNYKPEWEAFKAGIIDESNEVKLLDESYWEKLNLFRAQVLKETL